MNMLAITIGMVALTLPLQAEKIDGKWLSEREVGAVDGKTYKHTSTITLKSEGNVVTGTVVSVSEAPWMATMTGRSFPIKDGKIEGDKFSFKVMIESDEGERTSIYEGTVAGDRLKGVIKFRGIGQSWVLDAARVK